MHSATGRRTSPWSWGSSASRRPASPPGPRHTSTSSLKFKKKPWTESTHCNENPIYVFPEKRLRGLSPNFHIHVSVCDLIGPHIFLQENRQTVTDTWMWKIGTGAAQFLFWEYLFRTFGTVSMQWTPGDYTLFLCCLCRVYGSEEIVVSACWVYLPLQNLGSKPVSAGFMIR